MVECHICNKYIQLPPGNDYKGMKIIRECFGSRQGIICPNCVKRLKKSGRWFK